MALDMAAVSPARKFLRDVELSYCRKGAELLRDKVPRPRRRRRA